MIPKPVQRARRLIKKYGYNSPAEIDLIDLLYAEGLFLKYETTNAYQGKIVFNKHAGIITLNLNLENEYQKRYVIAHEMGHFFNEKLEIRNDNPDIENRDAENAIRNEKSCLAADKLETRQGGHFFNERALTQSRNKIWTRPLPEGEEVGYTQYTSGLQNELIVHEFKKDRYHYFVDTNTKSIEDLIREKEANQYFNEKLEIINDNPDIENRDAENAIRNEKSYLAADKLEIRQGGQVINDKLKKQRAGEERAQSEEIVHEFKKDRYHYFVDANTKSVEDLIREKEANQFAVELLMGRRWVVEAVSGKLRQKDSGQVLGVNLLKEVAEKFRVSLTAATLRYAELYKGAMAVILSVNNPEGMAFRQRIEWMTCNKNFEYSKLNKYEPVPLNTRTYDIYDYLMPTNYIRNQRIRKCGYKQFLKEQEEYKAALEETITVSSADWFEGTFGYLNEIDFAMMNYGSVLTVLWHLDPPDGGTS